MNEEISRQRNRETRKPNKWLEGHRVSTILSFSQIHERSKQRKPTRMQMRRDDNFGSEPIFTRSLPTNHNGDWAARRPHILCSICFYSFQVMAKDCSLHHFTVFTTSQCIHPNMCSICIFVNLQPVGRNLKEEFFDPQYGGG